MLPVAPVITMENSTVQWENVINNVGRGAIQRHRLIANRSRNWLLSLCFLACAKSVAGKELTDLETQLVNALQSREVGVRIIHGMAHAHRATPSDLRHQLFPERFAGLDVSNGVSFSDLAQAAPDIVASVLEQPNVRTLDIAAIHAARSPVRKPMRFSTDVRSQYGSPFVRAVMPETSETLETQRAIANRYVIKAEAFRCVEESSEWSDSDEVYWLFGSIAKGYKMTYRTRVFEDVDAGTRWSFSPGEGCFWGMDCKPHTFPEGEIGAVATLVERDHGDMTGIISGWNTAFAAAATVLAVSGAASWASAVVAGIGAVGLIIIKIFGDDHIDDAAWTWSRASINEVLDKNGGSYGVTEIFTDGDARYKLGIRVSRVV